MIKRIKKFVRDFFFIGGPSFEELECDFDVELVAQGLMLKKHAIESGKLNLPHIDSRDFDGTEEKAINLIRTYLDDVTERANKKMVAYWSTLKNTDIN